MIHIKCNPSHFAGGEVSNYFAEFRKDIREKGFCELGTGGFRTTFKRKNVVIKVPHVYDGIVDNIIESMAWHKYKSKPTDYGMFLAPCRLLPNKCLMMVKLDIKCLDTTPDWVTKLDSGQVGFRKDKLLAYDFGLDLSERDQWEEEIGMKSIFFARYWNRKPQIKRAG